MSTPYAYEFEQLMNDSMPGWEQKIERNVPTWAPTKNVVPLYKEAPTLSKKDINKIKRLVIELWNTPSLDCVTQNEISNEILDMLESHQ